MVQKQPQTDQLKKFSVVISLKTISNQFKKLNNNK
ncbi:uncharacterized protein METZ01_LOCUS231793 [marine metagenome]|uniref:Uncharacterized protein n=1 Tax=marine metagenome TaxID=408172 RepID=A0A382GVE9_9ZZZZ